MKIQTPFVDLCTGFRQSTREPNGLDALAGRLREIEGLQVGKPLLWNSDPIGHAKWVVANIDPTVPHSIVAYSYGANTALTMCRELQKRGRNVHRLYLIDGVKRIRTATFSWLARLWSMNPLLKLVVPSNVIKQIVWQQEEGLPKGHPVYKVTPAMWTTELRLIKPVLLDVPHSEMEDQIDIHETIVIDLDTVVTDFGKK